MPKVVTLDQLSTSIAAADTGSFSADHSAMSKGQDLGVFSQRTCFFESGVGLGWSASRVGSVLDKAGRCVLVGHRYAGDVAYWKKKPSYAVIARQERMIIPIANVS